MEGGAVKFSLPGFKFLLVDRLFFIIFSDLSP